MRAAVIAAPAPAATLLLLLLLLLLRLVVMLVFLVGATAPEMGLAAPPGLGDKKAGATVPVDVVHPGRQRFLRSFNITVGDTAGRELRA